MLKKELGEKVQQAFSTVVELELLFFEQERRAMNEEERQLKRSENGLETQTESESESSSDSSSIHSSDSSSIHSLNSSSTHSSTDSLDNQSDQSCDLNRSKLTAQFLSLYERVHSLGAYSVSNKHSIEIQ